MRRELKISQIYINLTEVRSVHSQLAGRYRQLATSREDLNRLRPQVDRDILYRHGIQEQLNRVQQAMLQVEGRMLALTQYMKDSADQYEQTEQELLQAAQSIGTESHTAPLNAGGSVLTSEQRRQQLADLFRDIGITPDTIVSFLQQKDNVKKMVRILSSISPSAAASLLLQERMKKWGLISLQQTDQLRTSLRQKQMGKREDKVALPVHMDIPPFGRYDRNRELNQVIYTDANGQQTVIDDDNMTKLVYAYHATGRNVHAGDILNFMNVDISEFAEYVMEQGYDPRTFLPLQAGEEGEIEAYVQARITEGTERRQEAREWQSELLEYVPVIGTGKEMIELIMGKDILTGEDISAVDYALAPLMVMGPLGKLVRRGGDEAADVASNIVRNNADDVVEGAGDIGRYSGNLEVVNKPDAAADALADRIGGQSRVKFSSDSVGREFDAISEDYVAQSKPALQTLNKSVRDQMKATFEAAQETGRKVYYHFEGQPAQSVIDKLNEYSSRYGIEVVIDTKHLK